MNRLLVILTFLFSFSSYAQLMGCNYGKVSSCPKNFYCTKLDKNKDTCLRFPDMVPVINFPFELNQKITCYKSEVLEKITSHAYNPSRFAADLYSKYGENATVVSVFDGTAYINDDCGPFDIKCGSGFGNSVKVVGNNGYMAFYAHLSKVLVRNGQKVEQGQAIGIEGATGSVGEEPITSINGFKHLHFSLHKYEDWGIQHNNASFPAFPSIPYKLKVKINGTSQIKDVRYLPCDFYSEGTLFQGF